MLRGSEVAQAPPSHGKRFGEAVDGEGAIIHPLQAGKAVVLCWWVHDVLIDFI